ncbi:MAG: alpha/beta fold hydrolase [Thermodesulfobacteriota bacterium]
MNAPSMEQKAARLGRVRLVFQEQGRGAPLLLLHGVPGPGIWSRVLPHLNDHIHCLCPHTLGLGASTSDDPSNYRLETQAEWMVRFLDEAAVSRVHLLGHDLGGVIALALAIKYPERVMKMILSHVPPRPDWVHPWVRRIHGWSRLPCGLRLFGRLLKRRGFRCSAWGWGSYFVESGAMDQGTAETWCESFSRARVSALRRLLAVLDPPIAPQTLEAARGYKGNAMLLWGCDYPPLSPSWAIQLYHEIPGAVRFELIPFAGHFPQWERPELFARAVLDFLLPGGRSRPEEMVPWEEEEEWEERPVRG